MKRYLSIIYLLLQAVLMQAQTGCINDSLLFYTDSTHWTIISNSYGVPSNVNAYYVIPQLNTIPGIPQAVWINYQTNWIMNGVINQPDDSTVFRYQFRMCQDDSVTLSFLFRRDNYCRLKLDGNTIFSEAPTAAGVNYNVGNNFLQSYLLLQGIHTFDFVVYNTYPYTGANGVGGIIGGYILSNNASLLMNTPGCIGASCCLAPPPLTITGDTSLCQGESTTLTASGAATISWTGGISNGTPFIPPTTTTYTVTATDPNGCSTTASITVHVNNTPVVQALTSAPSVCPGNPVTLTGSGATSYSWTGGAINGVSFVPSSTSTYTVTGTDANGCSNTSSVTITVANNLLVNIVPGDPLLCRGDSIQLNASGGNSYSWSPNIHINATNIPDPMVYPSSTTVYSVTATDAGGCTGSASVTIQVVDYPVLTLTKSGDIECGKNTVQLAASGAASYTWSPAGFLSNPNAAIPNATISEPTTFVVIGRLGTCVVTDSISVNVYNNEESSIFIPNAFSPNDDGKNDCLRVWQSANFLEYYFAIYNRWGQRVFESNHPQDCWDGYFKNQPVEMATYYYFLKAQTRCGRMLKKGDIIVIH